MCDNSMIVFSVFVRVLCHSVHIQCIVDLNAQYTCIFPRPYETSIAFVSIQNVILLVPFLASLLYALVNAYKCAADVDFTDLALQHLHWHEQI